MSSLKHWCQHAGVVLWQKWYVLIPCLVLLGALAAGVYAWAGLLDRMRIGKEQVHAELHARVENLAQSYAERVERTVGGLDRILLHVRYDWTMSKGMTRLEAAREAGVFPADAILIVSIFDKNGDEITTSVPRPGRLNIADRPYFQFHQDVRTDKPLIGPPMIGRASKRAVITISRRLYSGNGEFAGVVVASVRPEFLSANYSEATFGKHGYLGVAGFDRVMRVTRIGNHDNSALLPTTRDAFIPDPDSQRGAVFLDGKRWFEDGRSRIVGWHQVEGYSLSALVGLDEGEVLSYFNKERENTFSTAYWNTAVLTILTLLATTSLYLFLKRRYEDEAARIAYRAATEEGEDGFFINRPVQDRSGNIVDYLVVDCNHRGADLFQLQRHELVGKTIGDFYQGRLKHEAFSRLQDALNMGIHESEIKVSHLDRLKAKWINYKAVRSGGDLAVTIRDITEAKAHLHEMERRGNEDALTGLPNRHWIQNFLPGAIARAKETYTSLALLFIDVDGFKDINDALGHAAGDDLLKLIARRLKGQIRPQDHVVRLGGDEYVVVMEDLNSDSEILHVAERILQAFTERFQLSLTQHAVGVSIGISLYPRDGADPHTLLKNADIAMYEVKKNGKGNYRFYQPRFHDAIVSRLNNEIELRRAIDQDEFEMYYQLRVDIATTRPSSMEALIRWRHPTRGLVGPLEFIPLAESTGLILPLGELVVNKVCQQIATWARSGIPLVPVSVNVSPRQFNESDMLFIFTSALERHGLDPRLIEIEITESMMMQDTSHDLKVLASLRNMGIKLCLDDFGTGYSSLSQLQELDFDVLKIDMSFTRKVAQLEGRVLITAMITMAHALGLKVVAEGVETAEQLRILRELQCDEAQGYYFSEPVPANDLQAYISVMSHHACAVQSP